MEAKERYPEYIIRYLRQRKGLDVDDTSHDEQFHAMSPSDVFAETLEWNGMDCLVAGTPRSRAGLWASTALILMRLRKECEWPCSISSAGTKRDQ